MADARSKLDILYQDVLGEIHEIINRVETLKADIPSAADKAIQRLERQTGTMMAASAKNEKLLLARVDELTLAIASLKDLDGAMQQAARQHAAKAIAPLLKELNQDNGALRYYIEAKKIYQTLSDKALSAIVILAILFLIVGGSMFYLGMKVEASTENPATTRPAVNLK